MKNNYTAICFLLFKYKQAINQLMIQSENVNCKLWANEKYGSQPVL